MNDHAVKIKPCNGIAVRGRGKTWSVKLVKRSSSGVELTEPCIYYTNQYVDSCACALACSDLEGATPEQSLAAAGAALELS